LEAHTRLVALLTLSTAETSREQRLLLMLLLGGAALAVGASAAWIVPESGLRHLKGPRAHTQGLERRGLLLLLHLRLLLLLLLRVERMQILLASRLVEERVRTE